MCEKLDFTSSREQKPALVVVYGAVFSCRLYNEIQIYADHYSGETSVESHITAWVPSFDIKKWGVWNFSMSLFG